MADKSTCTCISDEQGKSDGDDGTCSCGNKKKHWKIDTIAYFATTLCDSFAIMLITISPLHVLWIIAFFQGTHIAGDAPTPDEALQLLLRLFLWVLSIILLIKLCEKYLRRKGWHN